MDTQKLTRMQKDLPANQRNPEYLLELGKMYYEISLGSMVSLGLENVTVSQLIDWHANHSAVSLLKKSYDIQPRIDSALLILNSYSIIGNYTAMLEFIGTQQLPARFQDEQFSIGQIYLYALTKKSLRLQAVQALYEMSPEMYQVARHKIDEKEEMTVEDEFNNSTNASSPSIFEKGLTREGFIEFAQTVLDQYQREVNARDYLSNNMEWNYEYCFNTAKGLHSEAFMQLAVPMYALAFALDPANAVAELLCGASLHYMGEHKAAIQKLNQFTDKRAKDTWGYIIGGNACAVINDLQGLEVLLSKIAKAGMKDPALSLLQGFYFESKNDKNAAQSLYRQCIHDFDNEMFNNIFNYRLQRVSM